ncbi:UDP-2,3-diacylglucosamine diphosphatase [Bacteroides caecigallinarum]|uniref:metallophosphoesterase n=1 Tax=Bacteroides caecigallinarum TaxID=1411144 RepID=UPI00195B063E|nr:UDP-2,3-diacylglucosamine diphosphatase [Bacteroides caecigallinarum]
MGKHYNTIILSDLHLGMPHAKVNELIRFLRSVTCERLILNGDIIDGWYISRHPKCPWRNDLMRLFRVISDMMKNNTSDVIYTYGNHDDFMRRYLGKVVVGIKVLKDYTVLSNGKRFFVTHGDCFDTVNRKASWLSKLGALCYEFLLFLNVFYNKYREMRHKAPFPFAKIIKRRTKKLVSNFTKFEKRITDFAVNNNYDGVVCGHIHHPEDTYLDNVRYLNSGDWIDNKSVVVEDEDRCWKVLS